MAVWGAYNVLDTTMAEAFNEAAQEEGARITRKELKADSFVLFGDKDGRIFYRKTILAGSIFASFELSYDPSLRSKYNAVIPDMARSLCIDPAFGWQ